MSDAQVPLHHPHFITFLLIISISSCHNLSSGKFFSRMAGRHGNVEQGQGLVLGVEAWPVGPKAWESWVGTCMVGPVRPTWSLLAPPLGRSSLRS